jgi:hypothetical protein
MRPYAFFVGRLERDFSQAREAIRTAVMNEAGIPCLWADDGRHRTNIDSIRERTRLLIKNASLVIADLTLGVESPRQANPSRAHEIGLALAYGKKLMLCSKEPRRYPYFSISDVQIFFWSDEADLEKRVRAWLRVHQDVPERRILNHNLPDSDRGYRSRLQAPSFQFYPRRRYIGPPGASQAMVESIFFGVSIGTVVFALANLFRDAPFAAALYWAACLASALITLCFFHQVGKRRLSPGVRRWLRIAWGVMAAMAIGVVYFG